MALPELRMCFADRAALEQELASNLKYGRAFVKDAGGVQVLADCLLLLVRPDDGAELELRGQAVFVSESDALRGIGVELRPFDADVVTKMEAFVRGERVSGVRDCVPVASSEQGIETETANADPEAAPVAKSQDDVEAEQEAASADDGAALDDDPNEDEPSSPTELQAQAPPHERMRKLSLNEQQKIARSGDLNDRVMLERLYGKGVWEGLLHNPKLTVPEVARIARKGTAPRPLLDLIIDNNTWIQAPIVRRALLGNPRVSSEAILKLLRITPKHELKVIYKTTTYSTAVRESARKVLDL
jgi:hypothetical protein